MLTLTLLDGPLAGRPMPLPAGTLTLGSDDADIAMTLDHDGQVTLSVDDTRVRLVTRMPVWADGLPLWSDDADTVADDTGDAVPIDTENAAHPLPALSLQLPLHRVIDLAGLGIWLSDGSRELPAPLPKRPARHSAQGASTDAAARHSSTGRSGERHRRRAPAAWLAISGLSLLIAGTGIAMWRTGTANVISQPPRPDALRTLAARIAPGVVLNTAGDAVRLSGGCLDDNTRARLRAEARWLGKALSDETWCPTSAVQTVETLLRLHGFTQTQVNVAPDGALLVGGPLVADARWRAASDALDALALPHGWRVADGTAGSFERLVKTLRDAGQLRGVDISRDRNGWRITGALSAGRQAALKGIADAWNLAGNTMPLRIEPLPPSIPTLGETGFSAPLVSIGGSPGAPQITLEDGTRLAQGVRLPGGTRVVAIHPDGVSIGAHDRLFYLPLTPETQHDDASDPA
ncbi:MULTISPECIES: type III secretion system inner membrane ring subunit SctD [Pandoraea]|uniref:type III secretion system inner membrane ring subunit SctD n=1 Tax=Pandoraea TaxID=93217 RepID=UPI001F5CC5A0|nr:MULTISPECIES: type III secretion system inner membrane ring subunit SctD [Pandoraea]MCI3203791.1 EscD/YscD/HrpQ family type III secretion system inner membrane ring protein [Pandoraea sp. LA3]MDN4581817.1 EscD/YscD/HrpQ family type III secretion system inner membrane ring protein [Pandoraea capi]